ncbi:MAG TPA: dockerin type I repeat-containing protein, partial [Vicinamibacterales bacterium]|nr:dockerin type I repeat-containing protein [Vicinamibacterales bacterium]
NPASGNGTCNANAIEPCTVTDQNGTYALEVAPGTYTIREVLKPGWRQTTPDHPQLSVTENGQAFTSIDFGNVRAQSVSGIKFDDLNHDGMLEAGEPVLQGWTVFDDANSNGKLDAGEQSDVTDSNGIYRLSGLTFGAHTIAEELRCGFHQTFPGGGGTHVVNISSNAALSDVDFGNEPPAALPGDSNDDGMVSAADLIGLADIIGAGSPPSPGADANGDGKVDSNDLAPTVGNAFNCAGLQSSP